MNESLLDARLRDDLRRLLVPETGADFDERVLRALRMPPPWYVALWQTMRPAAVSAIGSMFVMLGAIWLTMGHPIVGQTPVPSNANMCAIDWNFVDRVLSRPIVTAASLQECIRTAKAPPTTPVVFPRRSQGAGHASRRTYVA